MIPLFFNNMYVTLRSSTCFEQHPAHPREDKFYYYSLWYRMQVESGLQSALHLHTIAEAVVIQFVLPRMSRVLLETC